MNIGKGFFTIGAVLLRCQVGRGYAGARAVLNTALTTAFIVVWWLLLRGFASGTLVGSFFDGPVVIPALIGILLFVYVWLARTVGEIHPLGPLYDEFKPEHFTGHAPDWWLRFRDRIDREWTILQSYEPTILSVIGLLLILVPGLRVIGVMLVGAAAAVAYQTGRDRSANQDPDRIDFATSVLPPRVTDEVRSSVTFVDVPPEFLDGLPPDIRRYYEDHLKSIKAEVAEMTHTDPPDVVDGLRVLDPQTRGMESVDVTSRVTKVVLAASVVVLLVAVLPGKYGPLYQMAPERCVAAVESLGQGLVTLGLASPSTESDGLSEITGEFLRVRDPDRISELRDGRIAEARATLLERAREFPASIDELERDINASLGVPVSLDVRDRDFNRFLIQSEQARELWAEVVSGLQNLRRNVAAALDSSDWLSTDPQGDLRAWTRDLASLKSHHQSLVEAYRSWRMQRPSTTQERTQP